MLQRASQEVKEAQMFREKMGHVTEWMGRSQLPRNVKEKIRCYYSEVGCLTELLRRKAGMCRQIRSVSGCSPSISKGKKQKSL